MLRIAKTGTFPLPPILSADTYLLSFQASSSRPQLLSGDLAVKTVGTDALPLWKVRADLPAWLSVKVSRHGKRQTFANTITTDGLQKGSYHAMVRADNIEPRSGKPTSAIYYDVDLEITNGAAGQKH